MNERARRTRPTRALLPLLLSLLAVAGLGCATSSAVAPLAELPAQPSVESTELPSEAAPSRLPRDVAPTRYALELAIDPNADRFTGKATIDLRLDAPQRRLVLHGEGLEISQVEAKVGDASVRGRWEQLDAREGIARVVFERELPAGEATLIASFAAPYDETLRGLYRVRTGGESYAFTQFEPLAARRAFPCFDEPGFKTPFDVSIRAPSALRAFANTKELEVDLGEHGEQTTRFATTAPIPTYLVAFAVGRFDVVEATITPNEVRPSPLALRGIAPKGRGPELEHAMTHTPRILAALENYFGMPYPFDKLDIVAVPDFAAGAMENVGLVTFRDYLLLLGPNAPVTQQRAFASVMAHELAHQWFGNLVTMAWWDDLFLNEALATFMEAPIVAATFPEMNASIDATYGMLAAFESDSLITARRIRDPIESTHDIYNAFDSITYEKGAAVFSMIQHFVGEERFRDGIRNYLRVHAGGSATAGDLVSSLSAAAGQPLERAFDSFLSQPGVPLVETRVDCSAEHPSLALRMRRALPLGSSAPREGRWTLPFCARYGTGKGSETHCVSVEPNEAGEARVELPTTRCPTFVVPNADAAGYYRFTLEREWLSRIGRVAMRELSAEERLVVVDAIGAGVDDGTIEIADALVALAPFVQTNERSLVVAPMPMLAFARENLLATTREKRALDAYALRLYRATARRLGVGPTRGRAEPGETSLLRASILSFLALTVRDPQTRRELAGLGRQAVEGGTLHLDVVSEDLLGTALSVAVQESDDTFATRLEQMFWDSNDAVIRRTLLRAIASGETPSLRARALALSTDPALRVNEVLQPIATQMSTPEGRAYALPWLERNLGTVIARLGSRGASGIPYLASGFCSQQDAEAVRTLFAPYVASSDGGPRDLEAAIELITNCEARASAQRESARDFFSR